MNNIFKQDHPKGLYLLFCVEMWERFSYYGMRALLVLYMVQTLTYSAQKAGNIYGLYTGLVYLTPLIGGYLADRYLGQRKCITFGGIFMSAGLFCLASGIRELFFLALTLMIIANGFFKSNISSVLGLLYGDDNSKKDSGFTIFYMGINLGAFFSPLICGTLAVKFGFEYGFFAAGIGMLIGLVLYKIFEKSLLGESGLKAVNAKLNCLSDEEKKPEDVKKSLALLLLMIFTIPFWICFEQAGSSLTLFAQNNTNRIICGWEIPTGYFQSLNPLFIIIFAPIMSLVWQNLRQKSKEPSSVDKFIGSLFIMSFAYLIMTVAGYFGEVGKVSVLWLIFVYFIMTISELCISPIGLSLVSKLAPRRFLSLTMGCWFLTSFFGNMAAGIWGGQFDKLTQVNLFAPLVVLSLISAVILLLCKPFFSKFLK